MNYAIGCDVSRYNVSFDPSRATEPIDFAIQKATEGTGYIDLEYENIWQGVRQAPIRGAYHYLRSGMSWLAQTEHFLRTTDRHDYHLLALDLEEVNNEYSNTFFADAKRFIDRLRAVSNKRAVLYTNGSTFNQMVIALRSLYGTAGVQWMLEVPLWIASPGTAGAPILPKYRTNGDWLIHQYSWSGFPTRWGTGGRRVDENVWNGDVNTMRAYLHLPPVDEQPTSEPQPGEPMAIQWYRVNTAKLQIREGAGTSYEDIGDLFNGDRIETFERLGNWAHLTKIVRASGAVEVVNGWCSTAYCVPIAPEPPTQPAEVRPTELTVRLSDGSTWKAGTFTKVG